MKRTKSESQSPCNEQLSLPNPKRLKSSVDEQVDDCKLLKLSDDVLLNIFKHLSSFDLMSLHLSCVRLCGLCRDRTLWKEVDLREKHLPLEELKKFMKFLHPVTNLVALRGNRRRNDLPEIPLSFLKVVGEKCKQLENFILEEYSISRDKVQITNFPKTLKKFSLESSRMLDSDRITEERKSYFTNINTHMSNLTSLILTNCEWFDSHSIMAISKIPKLKEVKLNSCHGLEDEVVYTSLGCRYGLKSLEVVDLRDTFVGDSVIGSFSYTSTLLEIYLECPSSETVQQHRNESLQWRPSNLQEVYVVQIQQGHEVHHENPINFLRNLGNNNPDRCHVSDRALCSLGLCDNKNNIDIINSRQEVQLVRGEPRIATNPNLRKLVVRNYPLVTNQTLLHFTVNGPKLEYLDVTGTSITKEGLQNFKIHRPNVTIISSFDET